MQVNTASDLLEVEFTPVELNKAMQLQDSHLSTYYLTNLKVMCFRQIVALDFTPEKRDESEREHIYLRGQLKILELLIDGVLNPAPIPVGDSQSQSSPGA